MMILKFEIRCLINALLQTFILFLMDPLSTLLQDKRNCYWRVLDWGKIVFSFISAQSAC